MKPTSNELMVRPTNLILHCVILRHLGEHYGSILVCIPVGILRVAI